MEIEKFREKYTDDASIASEEEVNSDQDEPQAMDRRKDYIIKDDEGGSDNN